jgi:hypothetical protein
MNEFLSCNLERNILDNEANNLIILESPCKAYTRGDFVHGDILCNADKGVDKPNPERQ